MKLRRLAILPFICLVSCSSNANVIQGNYFYELRHTPNNADFFVFNEDKTQFNYNDSGVYFIRFDNEKFYGKHLAETAEEQYLGYVVDMRTIHLEKWASTIVSGDYELTQIKYKGEWK